MGYSLPPRDEQATKPQPDPNRPRQVRIAKRIAIIVGAPIVAFLALVALVAVFATPAAAPVTVQDQPAPSAVPAPPVVPDRVLLPPAAQAKPANVFGAGIREVGYGSGQMAPGTYSTDGPGPDVRGYCYYARLSALDGQTDSIIANVNTTGPTTVAISSTDAGFEIQGDCTFRKVR
jgi:hypothetical protein